MEIGINDLDFNEDDYGIVNEPNNGFEYTPDHDSLEPEKQWMDGTDGFAGQQNNDNEPIQQTNAPVKDDIIVSLLKSKGIEDITKIKFEDDEGNVSELDWNSLEDEEKLNILSFSDEEEDFGLDETELELINNLRYNQMSPEDYTEYIKQQAIAEYVAQLEGNPIYQIDEISDDELYIWDLKTRVEDITDEEAVQLLENEKTTNEGLFQKKMAGIRKEYQQLEDSKRQEQELLETQTQKEEFARFENDVVEAIESLDAIGGFDMNLEEEEMNVLANFILSTDQAGVSYLGKALNDPQTLVRMAWFALNGETAFDSISEYYNQQITEVSRTNYEKGYNDALNGAKPTKKTSKVVIKDPLNSIGKPVEKTINDLD